MTIANWSSIVSRCFYSFKYHLFMEYYYVVLDGFDINGRCCLCGTINLRMKQQQQKNTESKNGIDRLFGLRTVSSSRPFACWLKCNAHTNNSFDARAFLLTFCFIFCLPCSCCLSLYLCAYECFSSRPEKKLNRFSISIMVEKFLSLFHYRISFYDDWWRFAMCFCGYAYGKRNERSSRCRFTWIRIKNHYLKKHRQNTDKTYKKWASITKHVDGCIFIP